MKKITFQNNRVVDTDNILEKHSKYTVNVTSAQGAKQAFASIVQSSKAKLENTASSGIKWTKNAKALHVINNKTILNNKWLTTYF